ncbi:hypothetical protein IPD43_13630 [Paenibacillus polymyxa]|nr:hypothetical protein [Paenibacillus polymyxa]QPK51255.1 hypothetical protein G7035_13345 [Paenibacillus polymyxa]
MKEYVYSLALKGVLMQKTTKQPAVSGRHGLQSRMLGLIRTLEPASTKNDDEQNIKNKNGTS